jgi:hypothetical protein
VNSINHCVNKKSFPQPGPWVGIRVPTAVRLAMHEKLMAGPYWLHSLCAATLHSIELEGRMARMFGVDAP